MEKNRKKLGLDALSVSSFVTGMELTRGGRDLEPINSGQLQSCEKTLCGQYYTCGVCAYSGPADTCDNCNTINCPEPV
ncbi:hypothetical protein AB9P05_10755 [Roseivirga sp. BDSF3-8]|uniref:hypothetical protein n=1 Tax=Roseivirga sp. BDSF3-8 TaxID=3241598 RepID=UPI0035324199